MEDLHLVGGTPAVLKYLLAHNFIDGDCMTCTTHTLENNLKQCPELKDGQAVILPVEQAIKASGHLQMLYGNLAPDGSVAKITGKEGLQFRGPAAVFDGAPTACSDSLSSQSGCCACTQSRTAACFAISAKRSLVCTGLFVGHERQQTAGWYPDVCSPAMQAMLTHLSGRVSLTPPSLSYSQFF
jgi:hypothetical protein